MTATALASSPVAPLKEPPLVRGLPIIGNTLEMAKDPAKFFVRCYREYGPAFRVRVMGRTQTVLAGAEAANFLGTREGKDALRSKEFWDGLVKEYGATRTLTGTDGEDHKKLRDIMRHGFSREALRGRHAELVGITNRIFERDWKPGTDKPVLEAMQYLVVEQLGLILTGSAPLEYVKDIRTTILYILNILVTRQRPQFLLHNPKYKKSKAKVFELGQSMIRQYYASKDSKSPEEKNLIDAIMETHENRPDIMPQSDLILTLTGPYVAGLDTVANTTAATLYGVLKHPEVLRQIHAEVDAFFSGDSFAEEEVMKKLVVTNAAIMEAMRLWPIAVAQMRVANHDFGFAGYQVHKDEMIYIATSVPHFMQEFFPDPEKFDIGRYSKERSEHTQSGAYSPFGRGPHTCLGKTLAEVLMVLTMARIFWKLDLALESPDYELATKTTPTPGPATSFKVKIRGYRH
ncbi:MAG: cytochrome P450 [Proteobacteria bacterium]|nr:cytochrome P450 [Pseudomonadota bacterium]HQR04782.1 cytochrome P450 [Rhodocyclaceae bacterium]